MQGSKKKRIGILTGGGDCPGLNAGIRAIAKTAILNYDMDVIGIKDGFLGLIENRFSRISYEDVSGILTLGGTFIGASNKANPFSYMTQVSVAPPTFVFFLREPKAIHFSYQRFLTNRIRETCGFDQVPLRLIFRKKNR